MGSACVALRTCWIIAKKLLIIILTADAYVRAMDVRSIIAYQLQDSIQMKSYTKSEPSLNIKCWQNLVSLCFKPNH